MERCFPPICAKPVDELRSFNFQASTGLTDESIVFIDNSISTSKYNIVTFVPRALFEQFRRLANCYFVLISALMIIGTYTTLFDSPLSAYSTLIPLIIVLSLTMAKEGFEDLKRHKSDNRINAKPIQILQQTTDNNNFTSVASRNLNVGRIIRIHDREEIPADAILLTSSEEGGIAYIETANIDGETNLKIKASAPTDPRSFGPAWKSPEDLLNLEGSIKCEQPDSKIHVFNGTLAFDGREVSVDHKNFLLRGSVLRNTKWVLALVIYTGKQTKIVMNSRAAPSKLSSIESTVNKMIYLIFAAQFSLVTISFLVYLSWDSKHSDELWYICENYENSPNQLFRNNCDPTGSTQGGGLWFTFLILYNNFIPISLYVTVEIVNYIQASFIDTDIKMYDDVHDVPALARTSNMNADLGQIQYIFSDKTGTLTQNEMKFKRCSIAGKIYGFGLDETQSTNQVSSNPVPTDQQFNVLPLENLISIAKSSANWPEYIFSIILSVCHTVVIGTDDQGRPEIQAESPDEEALVTASKELGFEFVGRSTNEVFVQVNGQRLAYKIHATCPFNSTRKRMSVIVESPEGRFFVLCKGADNIMFDRASSFIGSENSEVLSSHLSLFAKDGLRTLVLGSKELSKAEFSSWFNRLHDASVSTTNRSEKLDSCYEEVEREMTIIGATAIEDKLQDDVPNTIADLRKAGIRVWVLTGDKMETAINIGYSCRLLVEGMFLIKMEDSGPELTRKKIFKLAEKFHKLQKNLSFFKKLQKHVSTVTNKQSTENVDLNEEENADTNEEEVNQGGLDELDVEDIDATDFAFIVDGPSLIHILNHTVAKKKFLQVACMCKSVIACRVSPAQKRLLVNLVKTGLKSKPITLSVGDGANDVGMIQEAQIGVGISGREGRQAVNNSDFAIGQFKFLRRLILVHGRWNYRRISKVLLYSFYKNIVLTFILFYFSFSTGFSGQSLFESLVYSGFNWFLAMPILLIGVFDRDVSEQTVLDNLILYDVGRLNKDLNVKIAARWIFQAGADSLLLFLIPYYIYRSNNTWGESSHENGLYIFGTTVYTLLIMSMMLKVSLMTKTWNAFSVFFWFGSLALYFIFISVYSTVLIYAPEFYWVGFQMMNRSVFWLSFFAVPVCTLTVQIISLLLKQELFPSIDDLGYIESSDAKQKKSLSISIKKFYDRKIGKHTEQSVQEFKRDLAQEDENLGICNPGLVRMSSFAFDHVANDYGIGAGETTEKLEPIDEEKRNDGNFVSIELTKTH